MKISWKPFLVLNGLKTFSIHIVLAILTFCLLFIFVWRFLHSDYGFPFWKFHAVAESNFAFFAYSYSFDDSYILLTNGLKPISIHIEWVGTHFYSYSFGDSYILLTNGLKPISIHIRLEWVETHFYSY